MKPLVSVLMPAYNHERYIAQSIESIINQTYKNIEFIIINDGSKDNTWEVIKSLEKKCIGRFVEVKLATQINRGIYDTLNKLVSLSSGKYIYFIASDDIAKPNSIEILCTKLESDYNLVVAVGDSEIIDDNSNQIAWDIAQNPVDLDKGYVTFWQYFVAKHPRLRAIDKNLDFFGAYRTLLKGNYIPNGALIRSDALKNIDRFTNKAPLEDWYMHLQLSKMGKYKFIDEVLFSYRWHSYNTIKNKKLNRIKVIKTKRYEFYQRIKFIIKNYIFLKK
ncbi:glycosyltransferase [Campylobacter porcelli]|uniref:Glycosyltransferase n=1 Tax=Campylobacter porcelli TaxID=1660073 RepID=A0A1X9SXY1_9BACT|nr:glycosyltransferase [Campylobacter sp. RM6137]ARR01137.1 glycosyltransferase, family 2 [Campylobacter sp. RM6137]MEE3705560.1 glycosyltransferase [Campylobacter sp. CX2-8023-23]MEE3745262.1 glycosyltransferase [Campylobacter sp. CX2-4855-23]